MGFTPYHRGELKSAGKGNARRDHKHELRRSFRRQPKELWIQDPIASWGRPVGRSPGPPDAAAREPGRPWPRRARRASTGVHQARPKLPPRRSIIESRPHRRECCRMSTEMVASSDDEPGAPSEEGSGGGSRGGGGGRLVGAGHQGRTQVGDREVRLRVLRIRVVDPEESRQPREEDSQGRPQLPAPGRRRG